MLGLLSVPLPLLPTTLFLLMAAACFLRGSSHLYVWRMSTRMFGASFHDDRAGQGSPDGTKPSTISLLWTGISVPNVLLVQSAVVRRLLNSPPA